MKEKLQRNICNLDGYTPLSKVEDLPVRQKEYIGDGLKYACQFWAKHLLGVPSSGHNVEEVQEAIDIFFTTCLLFWVEVLGITRNLCAGVHAINDIQQWYISVSCGELIYYSLYSH